MLLRLRQNYGENWLPPVNANRVKLKMMKRKAAELRDTRFCLAVFGADPAAKGWASDDSREAAMRLKRLLDTMTHENPLTPQDLHDAKALATLVCAGIPTTSH